MRKMGMTFAAILALMPTIGKASENPVFFLAQVQISDEAKYFENYGAQVGPLLEKAGAQILVAAPVIQTLEGDWPGNWTVVIRFNSEADARAWYTSEAYQAIRPIRLQATSMNNLVLAPAFVPNGK